jgi:hypothetical protein
VLSAEDQLLASVRQLVDVQSRALTLDIGLHRALGGGWSESAGAPDAAAKGLSRFPELNHDLRKTGSGKTTASAGRP